MLKKLFSHTAIYGLAPQLPKIVGIFILPITTKYLTKNDFGIYTVITAIVAAVSIFSSLGLNVVLGNMFIKSPNHYKWGWKQIYGFLTLWNIPYCIILGLIIYLNIPPSAHKNSWEIILSNVAPVVLFGATSILGTTYYIYKQKPLQIALRSMFAGLITMGLNLVFIAYYKLGYLGWFYSGAIGQFLFQLSYWIPLNLKLGLSPIFKFKWRFIKQNLKISLPTVPHYYGGYLINSSDKVVMNKVGISIGDTGLYGAAGQVANPVQLAGVAAGQAINPILYQSYKDKKERNARNFIFLLQIILLTGTFLLSIWIKEVFTFLIKNKELHAAYPSALILIMGYSYRAMYYGANNRLFYYEKTKVLLKITFVAGITNLLLNIIFIPIWGYQVAAYTTFIALMYMGYVGYYLKVFKETNKESYYPLFWLILTLTLTIVAYFICEFSSTFRVFVTIITIITALLGLRKYSKINE